MKRYLIFILIISTLSGFTTINRGRIDSLKTLVDASLKKTAVPDTTGIKRLNQLAANYFKTNPDSTIYYGNKSIAMSRKINYKAGLAEGLVQIGQARYFKGDFKQATHNFDDAVTIYQKLGDKKGMANTYKQYGRMYNLLAKYKIALVYLNRALELNKQIQNDSEVSDCYKNIGIVYYSEGQLSTALDYYYKALGLSLKQHNDRACAQDYNDIGVVLQSMEVYPKALDYFKKALKLFKGTGDVQGVGTVNENIGEVLLEDKQYDRSISYLSKSIDIAKMQDDKEGMSSVFTDIGISYAHKNQFKLALDYLSTSLEIAKRYKIVYNEAYTLIGYATVYNLQKDFKNAYKYATEGQQLAVKLGNLSVRSKAALQLNKTMAGLGRFDEAYKLLKQYIDLKDSLNNNESIQKLTSYSLEVNFNNRKKQIEQQQHERDLLFKQNLKQQRLTNIIFLIIISGMVIVSVVYYRQKRKHQKINLLLAERNREVVKQKTDIDEQASKLNDLNTLKDRLISVLAHDLRAPLSTLRGLFSLLQDDTISHSQMLEMIPNVLKKLEYTSDFLDTLLFWINSQMENFENSAKSFHVKDIVAYETESYREQALVKGISLIDNVDPDVVASADPNSIRIVIRNLITNAIKFSGANDRVEVSAMQQDDQSYVISVKDSGTGMTADQLGKLFKSKVNSKAGTKNESGTGMGLLFCKDLVEKCNGTIWVTSVQGIGTEFSFTIPAGQSSEVAELV